MKRLFLLLILLVKSIFVKIAFLCIFSGVPVLVTKDEPRME